MYASAIKERVGIVAHLVAQSYNAGTYLTEEIDVGKTGARRLIAYVMSGGTVGGTVDFKFQGSLTAGGTYADIDATNASIAQITTTDKINTIEMPAEALLASGKGFIKGLLTVGTAACIVAVLVEAHDLRFVPASDTQLAVNITNVTSQKVYTS